MITWKKIGVKGKPVWVADWPTFIIEIHISDSLHAPFVKTKDGVHGYGIGLYGKLTTAQAESEKHGEGVAAREAGRSVNHTNPPLVLGPRKIAQSRRKGF